MGKVFGKEGDKWDSVEWDNEDPHIAVFTKFSYAIKWQRLRLAESLYCTKENKAKTNLNRIFWFKGCCYTDSCAQICVSVMENQISVELGNALISRGKNQIHVARKLVPSKKRKLFENITFLKIVNYCVLSVRYLFYWNTDNNTTVLSRYLSPW